jgi:hypothetical protein
MAPTAAPATTTRDDPDNDEQHNGTHGGVDDQSHCSDAKMDVQSRQQPITNEGADNSDDQVADEPEAPAPHNLTSQPPCNNADDDYDEETLVRKMHDNSLKLPS